MSLALRQPLEGWQSLRDLVERLLVHGVDRCLRAAKREKILEFYRLLSSCAYDRQTKLIEFAILDWAGSSVYPRADGIRPTIGRRTPP